MTEGRNRETVRVFIAIELDAAVREALDGLQSRLKRAPQSRLGRWVAPESIHLTLKFLGEVPASRVPELQQALERACAGVPPFELAVTGLGCFPDPKRPRVVWVGVEELTGALVRLQRAVEAELGRLGFRPEGRGFTPHLTLARVRDQANSRERAELGAWIGQQAVGWLAAMRVGQVCLMRSVLRPEGAVYIRLGAAPLQPAGG
jgi:2'-5' RNA ligase